MKGGRKRYGVAGKCIKKTRVFYKINTIYDEIN